VLRGYFVVLGAGYRMLGAGKFMLTEGFGMLDSKTERKKSNQEVFFFFLSHRLMAAVRPLFERFSL
jgi:hypothetical protein